MRVLQAATYLELVRHHVPQALIVYRTDEDVGPEGLPSVATDHGLPCTPSNTTQTAATSPFHTVCAKLYDA